MPCATHLPGSLMYLLQSLRVLFIDGNQSECVVPAPHLNVLRLEILLEEALHGDISQAPGAAVHLSKGADANARAQLNLLGRNLPFIHLMRYWRAHGFGPDGDPVRQLFHICQ